MAAEEIGPQLRCGKGRELCVIEAHISVTGEANASRAEAIASRLEAIAVRSSDIGGHLPVVLPYQP